MKDGWYGDWDKVSEDIVANEESIKTFAKHVKSKVMTEIYSHLPYGWGFEVENEQTIVRTKDYYKDSVIDSEYSMHPLSSTIGWKGLFKFEDRR